MERNIKSIKNEYHRTIDDQIVKITENLRNITKYSKFQEKSDTEKSSNTQLKTSNLIIMNSIQNLFLLLQKIKHHSIFFNKFYSKKSFYMILKGLIKYKKYKMNIQKP